MGLATSKFGLPGNKIDIEWWVETQDEKEAREEEEKEPVAPPEPVVEPTEDP